MWPEIEKALKEKRHELKLLPDNVNKDLSIDESLFLCQDLNLLSISDSNLRDVPVKIGSLAHLQNLLMFHNKIERFPAGIPQLGKLKVLDLSYNCITSVPEEINELSQLTTLNMSYNAIESFPVVGKLHKLAILNLSGNKLKSVPELANETLLSELILSENEIASIPEYLNHISATLKVLNLEKNQIKQLPKFLSTLPKLKDLLLKGNPIADKRLLKLINQCGTKQVVDYVKQHGIASAPSVAQPKAQQKSGAKQEVQEAQNENQEPAKENPHIFIGKFNDEQSLRIISTEAARQTRPHIVCCIWKNVCFDPASFRAFIQIQTKLHDTVCQKRELCTIATHDFDKIVPSPTDRSITYTAGPGDKIPITPLGRRNQLTAQKFYEELRNEAEALRKEKKRNTYSGIHKYLHLLDKAENFAFFKDSAGTTISLPPLTNSDNTACSAQTKNILIEITSSSSLPGCKQAFDAFISEIMNKKIGLDESSKLFLDQVKVVDEEGNLRTVYPSKVDLQFDGIEVQRE